MTDCPKKTRLFTGCWACRLKKRKCDEMKPVCTLCIAHGCECSYDVKLTWNFSNIFFLGKENEYISMDECEKTGQLKKSMLKASKKPFSKCFTISDRRFKIYNTECKMIHQDQESNQKIIDKRLTKALNELETLNEDSIKNDKTTSIGPFAVFKTFTTDKREKQKKIQVVVKQEYLEDSGINTLSKIHKKSKSAHLIRRNSKDALAQAILVNAPSPAVLRAIPSHLNKNSAEQCSSPLLCTRSSSSVSSVGDASTIFENESVDFNNQTMTAKDYTQDKYTMFANSVTTVTLEDLEKSNELSPVEPHFEIPEVALDKLSRLLTDDEYLIQVFIENINKLTIELKYGISSIIVEQLNWYLSNNDYEHYNGLIEIIRWCVCECEPNAQIPNTIIKSIYYYDTNIDVHFVNMIFLILTHKDYNINNYLEWLYQWFQKNLILFTSENNGRANSMGNADYSLFLILIEFYVCKESLGYGIQIIPIDRLITSFKLLSLLSGQSSTDLKFDIELIRLKINFDTELIRRFSDNIEVQKYYRMELDIDTSLLQDVYNI